jgi:hypothetical protein
MQKTIFFKRKEKKSKRKKKLGQGFRVFTIIGKPKRGLLWVPHTTGGPTLVWFGLVWFGLVSKRGGRLFAFLVM